jgi:hypothetical protein
MSLVFQNIDPPPPSPPGECVLPPPSTVVGVEVVEFNVVIPIVVYVAFVLLLSCVESVM